MNNDILISILIPAYNYKNGIELLLNSINYNEKVEVIIYDDSTSDEVERYVNNFARNNFTLLYKRNLSTRNAINNWNNLLNIASGKFCILMHHDEYFFSFHFLNEIIELIQKNDIDIIVFRCLLVDQNSLFLRYRYHMPIWLQKFVIKYIPFYLFLHNVLGPPSILLVRNCIYPRYDINLKLKVDVDLYYRLAIQDYSWLWYSQIIVCSVLNNPFSITGSIKSTITKLSLNERTYINSKYNNIFIKFIFSYLYLKLDFILWIFFRIYYLIYILITYNKFK